MTMPSSFNSRAPRGARRPGSRAAADHHSFNSRAPRGARQDHRYGDRSNDEFQFTCPSRSTTVTVVDSDGNRYVSIHVPLAEHDIHAAEACRSSQGFNSRAPRGARRRGQRTHGRHNRFQFTCPSRSTTTGCGGERTPPAGFNSRAPRGARLPACSPLLPVLKFQFTCPSRSTTIVVQVSEADFLSFNSRAPRGARQE